MAGAAFQSVAGGQYGQQQSYGQHNQQQYGAYGQQQQQTGQADYSAQWAAYYANLGQTNQAAGSSQSTENTPAPAPTPAPATGTDQSQPKADAYYDDFFRYSYHYGEEAARQYYGAWSPPA